MADVTIRCPTTGARVSVGIETDPDTWSALIPVVSLTRCSACHQDHSWWTFQAECRANTQICPLPCYVDERPMPVSSFGIRRRQRISIRSRPRSSVFSRVAAAIGFLFAVIAAGLRIPTIATTRSVGSRPPIPIDRDQCGAEREGAVGCLF